MFNLFKRKKHKTITAPTYKSCKTLPMYNFYNILDSDSDYRWLLKGFDEDSDIILSDKEKTRLNEVFQNIFNDYIELKKDTKVINTLKQRAIISNLENRMFWGVTLLKMYVKNQREDIIKELKSWKFHVDIKKPVKQEVDKITKQLKGLRTRINMEVSKYEKMTNKNGNKKQEKVNIDAQTIAIAKTLDLNYPIIAKTTTVSQWISYCKQAEQVVKQRNKQKENS